MVYLNLKLKPLMAVQEVVVINEGEPVDELEVEVVAEVRNESANANGSFLKRALHHLTTRLGFLPGHRPERNHSKAGATNQCSLFLKISRYGLR